MPCDDCVAYTSGASQFAYIAIRALSSAEDATEAQPPVLGNGESWALSNGTEQCRFVPGFDLPDQDDLLEGPSDSAFGCCSVCDRTEGPDASFCVEGMDDGV